MSIILLFAVFVIFLMPKIVDVHDIRKQPASIKGSIGVIGNLQVMNGNSEVYLLTDIKRKCKVMPVFYKGQMPEVGSEIIAYGIIRKVDGTASPDILWFEYFVEAESIKGGKNRLAGRTFYLIRQWTYRFARWFFSICNKCDNLKNMLISLPFYS